MSRKNEYKEHPNLEKIDWRVHGATTLAKEWRSPFTGVHYKKGEVFTAVVEVTYRKGSAWFNVPNSTAMFLNLSHNNYEKANQIFNSLPLEKEKRKKQSLSADKEIIDYYEHLFASIVFAFTAIESFTNEYISENFIYTRTKNDGSKENLNKYRIEREVSIDDKISVILPGIFNLKFSKQKKIWNDYKTLKNRRDRIIHMKSKDRKSATKDKATIWKEMFAEPIFNAHKIAFNLIEYFLNELEMRKKPRWYLRYPNN